MVELNKYNLNLIMDAKGKSMREISENLPISYSYLRTIKHENRRPKKGTKGNKAIHKINRIAQGLFQNRYILVIIVREVKIDYYLGIVKTKLTERGIQNALEKYEKNDVFEIIKEEIYFNHKNFDNQFTEKEIEMWRDRAIKLNSEPRREFKNLPEFVKEMRKVLIWK